MPLPLPEISSSVSRRRWVIPVVFGAIAVAVAFDIFEASRVPVQQHSLPRETFHIPEKCRKQAFDITQGQLDANLPMMQARELEDLANRCGGWVEKK